MHDSVKWDLQDCRVFLQIASKEAEPGKSLDEMYEKIKKVAKDFKVKDKYEIVEYYESLKRKLRSREVVSRRAHIPKFAGSSPASATKK